MNAIAEFRIPEGYAKEFLRAETGMKVMDFVRRVRVPVGSPAYENIGDIYRLVRHRDHKYFFLGWEIRRQYSPRELEMASLLLLKISKTFEPAGAECGTVYDYQDTCNVCGSGIKQASDLVLDLATIPKNVDIARTISNEIVISKGLARLLAENKVSGYRLGAVRHKDSASKAAGSAQGAWSQLRVRSLVTINPATKTGEDPFDGDINNSYRCKNGHTAGLSILSELSIYKDSWDGSDIVETKQLFGVNRGLLRTYPLLAISQRLYRMMMAGKCKGFTVEVVNLVD